MELETQRAGCEMPKAIKWTRVFFAVAIVVSAIVEFYSQGTLDNPVTQYSISALGGAAGVFAAKLTHIL